MNVKVYDFVGCDKKLVALDDYAALQQKLDALATHNSALMVLAEACSREYESAATGDCKDDEKVSYPEYSCHITFGMIRNALKAPNTEAYLNSVRADGVEMLAAQCDGYPLNHVYTHTKNHAEEFASQLRAGKDGE